MRVRFCNLESFKQSKDKIVEEVLLSESSEPLTDQQNLITDQHQDENMGRMRKRKLVDVEGLEHGSGNKTLTSAMKRVKLSLEEEKKEPAAAATVEKNVTVREEKKKEEETPFAAKKDSSEEEDWMNNMSADFLNDMIGDVTPEVKKPNFENQSFINQLFKVEFYQKSPDYTAYLELKLSPPLDQSRQPILDDFVDCPILFKLKLRGRWALQLWVEKEDYVRVIGNFNRE